MWGYCANRVNTINQWTNFKNLYQQFIAAFFAIIIAYYLPVNNLPVNFSFDVATVFTSSCFSFIVTFWIIVFTKISYEIVAELTAGLMLN